MAHEVESMFSTREVPWHGLGKVVEEAPDSREAIKLAGLNWQVTQEPVYVGNPPMMQQRAENYVANVRNDNRYILGVVTNRYQIVQNHEAFAFTDDLLGQGVTYETAGSLKNGQKIWLLARAPEEKILGDTVVPYLCFMNTHDGSGAVRVLLTPIRVVCNNTLNVALNTAQRSWSAKHVGNLDDKIEDARETLELTKNYMEELNEAASSLVKKSVNENDIEELINELLPIPENASKRQSQNIETLQNDLRTRYYKAPDLEPFRGTAWGFVGAVSDFVTHVEPRRKTATFQERRFEKLVNGHNLLDRAKELLA